MATRHIDVWADLCCPFTYVGLVHLLDARAERGVDAEVQVHAWPLELVNGRPLDPAHVAREVAAIRASVAPELFGGFDPGAFPATSLPAMALAAAAYEAGGPVVGEELSMALRRAVFEEGRDVASPSVLAELAAGHGLGVPSAGPAPAASVLADYAEGRRRGVVGSPHFFVAGHDWFCPVLEISQADGVFEVSTDPDAVGAFLDACLGPT